MKKIINGKRYDTDTARVVGAYTNGMLVNDLSYVCETLYIKRNGEYFLHGEGGAMSKYAQSHGNSSWGGGELIIPMSYEAAREWAERNLEAEEYESEFSVVDDDEVCSMTCYVKGTTLALIRRAAQREGATIGSIVDALAESLR